METTTQTNKTPFFLEVRMVGPHVNSRNLLFEPTHKDLTVHKQINQMHPFNRDKFLNLIMTGEGLDDTKYLNGLTSPARPNGLIAVVFDVPYQKHMVIELFHNDFERNRLTFNFSGNEVSLLLSADINLIKETIKTFISDY